MSENNNGERARMAWESGFILGLIQRVKDFNERMDELYKEADEIKADVSQFSGLGYTISVGTVHTCSKPGESRMALSLRIETDETDPPANSGGKTQ